MKQHIVLLSLIGFIVLGGMAIAATPTTIVSGSALTPTLISAPTKIPVGTSHTVWTPVEGDFDGVAMMLVPPGCFMMGSDHGDDDEKPIHEVCFDQPFWMDKYEVSQAQFRQFGGKATSPPHFKGDPLPIEQVKWKESQAFCETRGARLPTEAEWEYAARGPENLIYPWGNEFKADNAIYAGNSGDRTAPVGSRPGGVSWVGVYNLSGNVGEWVADWYDETYYANSPKDDPQGPSRGRRRVVRGGSWTYFESVLTTYDRNWVNPDFGLGFVGMRCVRDFVEGETNLSP